ncbi:hypothetical protein [Burkholderia vietnamiensis]|uniref:hypothetical protein n=1 Tax=Burkholderia vietnamiensis TaxID=60552 RepID=UPI0012D8E8C1|nr:hypothetical protein [Burkholderia vietnamiensis]MBR8219562.1 hypothetical protein [Burkholderia vietnamiensis]MCO1346864.1 hypothetical protein [Burkholderia vietnamiensis]MCO1429046.1 hypothetical protein [Burkholderia vietnamiensis]MDN7667160.1 hypothetical protein [Burkholderia vietnamiensis]UQN49117.1 hypothetical protein L0Y95_24395 [Burkholderia vietnamiensis]
MNQIEAALQYVRDASAARVTCGVASGRALQQRGRLDPTTRQHDNRVHARTRRQST